MRILRLTIQNLNSLRGKTTLDFTQAPLANTGLFAITGDTGAGKTTILDAITLAIYGQVPRNNGNATDTLSYGTTEGLAEVEFEHGGKEYRAKWTVNRARGQANGTIQPPRRELSVKDPNSANFQIITTGIKELTTRISEITGLDYARFRQSVLLAQGEFAAFLDAADGDRSGLLERITGTEIYSEISKAARDRKKLEEEKLASIEEKMRHLQVLEEDALAALHEKIRDLKEQADTAKQHSVQLKDQISIKTSYANLQDQLRRLDLDEAALSAKKLGHIADFTRLLAHERGASLHAGVQSWDNMQRQIKDTTERLTSNIEKRGGLEREMQTQMAAVEMHRHALTTLEQWFKEQKPIWQEVSDLDILIEERQRSVLESGQKLDAERTALVEQQAQVQNLEGQIAQLRDAMEKEQAWQDKNAHLAGLPTVLPAIQGNLANFRALHAQWIKAQKEVAEVQTSLDAIHKQQHAVAAILNNWYLKKVSNQEAIAGLVLPLAHDTAKPLGQAVLDQQDRLWNRKIVLAELEKHLVEHIRLQDALHDRDKSWEDYQQRNAVLVAQRDACQTKCLALQKTLDFKKEVYRQQQLLVNYEKDRAALSPGEACPLCLSKAHPFREHPVVPFLDQAAAELKEAERAFDEESTRYHTLVMDSQQLALQWQALKPRAGLLDALNACVAQITLETARATALELPTASVGEVRAALQQTVTDLDMLQRLKSKVESLENEGRDIEVHLKEQEAVAQKINLDASKLQGTLATLVSAEADLCAQHQVKYDALSQELLQWGMSFIVDDMDTIERNLMASAREVAIRQRALQTNQQALNSALHQREYMAELVRTEAAHVENMHQQHTGAVQNLNDLKQQRYARFGTDMPAVEVQKAERQITAARAEMETANQALTDRVQVLNTLIGVVQEQSNSIQKWEKEATVQEAALLQGCARGGFLSIDALRASILTQSEKGRIEALKMELLREETTLASQRTSTKEALKKIADQANLLPDMEELRTAVDKNEKWNQHVLEDMAIAAHTIAHNTQQQCERQMRLKERADQKAECARWAQLDELIGSADGKKFRVFAQGLTLGKLVSLANRHLNQLSGRYLISVNPANDALQLLIRDTYQADTVRSMKTLSGGERFLVSLALALGLSEMAGREIQIQSLFIDEGFGTLDDATLDMALTTLENLQASGKTIGVISHVKELKERIAVKIQVNKLSNGFSKVEVVAH